MFMTLPSMSQCTAKSESIERGLPESQWNWWWLYWRCFDFATILLLPIATCILEPFVTQVYAIVLLRNPQQHDRSRGRCG